MNAIMVRQILILGAVELLADLDNPGQSIEYIIVLIILVVIMLSEAFVPLPINVFILAAI
jgi:hypothetical protein